MREVHLTGSMIEAHGAFAAPAPDDNNDQECKNAGQSLVPGGAGTGWQS